MFTLFCFILLLQNKNVVGQLTRHCEHHEHKRKYWSKTFIRTHLYINKIVQ